MTTFRDGTVNLLSQTNPGVGIDIILPQPFVAGVPTNIEAQIGVGSWGPVNTSAAFSDPSGCPYGPPQVRPYDIATHVAASYLMGGAIAYRGVRVTDGTDTAAISTLPGGAGVFTGRYTGSLGNQLLAVFQNTAAIGAYAAVISFPGRNPERFDNIYPGLSALTATPGTGYTSVPTLSLSAPQKVGGIQAAARASLVAVGTPAVAAGGTGYAVNDTLTLGAGVVVKVTAVNAGAITTVSVVNAGTLTSGAVPAGVGTPISTSGAGTGAAFTLVFGLGPATIVNAGSGYYVPTGNAITVTMSGGGGTGGAYVPVTSFWAGLASAINNGTTVRGPSNVVVFAAGTSTATPTIGVVYTFSGGTDGAAGVTTAQLVGTDIRPRTGMYALRGSGMDTFALCDCTDSSIWGAMLALGISENAYPVAAMASGTQIEDAVAARAANGIDDPWIKILVGDWPTFYDQVNGSRLVSPTAFFQGLCGNLSPEQSPINKELIGVSGTQTSQQGILTADADESIAQVGGVDLIGRSAALGATYFSFLTGRNSSSNTAAQGDEYTRLTNYLARSLNSAATRAIVGKLQSTTRKDDPTRLNAYNVLASYLQTLKDETAGSGGYGLIEDFTVVCDLTNNSPATIQRGFLFAYCAVKYLNTVRYFIIRLAGGGNVQIQSTSNSAQLATITAQMAGLTH